MKADPKFYQRSEIEAGQIPVGAVTPDERQRAILGNNHNFYIVYNKSPRIFRLETRFDKTGFMKKYHLFPNYWHAWAYCIVRHGKVRHGPF